MRTGRSRRRRVTASVLGIQVVAAIAVSCGIPTGEDSFERIDELPNQLDDPTTTTTSTTTTTTTTTIPDVPVSTVATTTTSEPVPLRTVLIYFFSRGQLIDVPFEVVETEGSALRSQLISLLEAGTEPLGAAGVGLESFVEPGLIRGRQTIEGGVITIDLDGITFDNISIREQTEALAQIVFTFLQNTTAVGQVRFTIDGEPFRVPTDRGARATASIDDYASLTDATAEVPASTNPAVDIPGLDPSDTVPTSAG